MEQTKENNLNKYIEAVKAITKEQSKIVGEVVALELARNTEGLHIDKNENITFTGDPVHILEELVNKYSLLFGNISIEVSKEAVEKLHLFEIKDLPANLR